MVGDRRGYLDFKMSIGGVGEATLSGSFGRSGIKRNGLSHFEMYHVWGQVEAELQKTRDYEIVFSSAGPAVVAARPLRTNYSLCRATGVSWGYAR